MVGGPWTPCVHVGAGGVRSPEPGAARALPLRVRRPREPLACSGQQVPGAPGARRAALASLLSAELGDQSWQRAPRPEGARERFNEPAAKDKTR